MAIAAGLAAAMPAGADVAELFGRADGVWDAQVSPDGAHVALGCSPTGVKAVCIFDLTGSGGEPDVVYPGEELKIDWYYWASDQYLVTNVSKRETLRTSSGLQDYDVRRAISYDLETGKYALLMRNAGAWDDLTGLTAVCDNDPGRVVMSITYRASEEAGLGSRVGGVNRGLRTDTYSVDLKTGRARKRPDREASIIESWLDDDCEPFVDVIYNDERGDFAIDVMGDRRRRIHERNDAALMPMAVMGLAIDRQSLVLRVDDGDTFGTFSMSLADGTMAPLTLNGQETGRLGAVRDTYSNTVIGFQSAGHLVEHTYLDEALVNLQALVEGALPGQTARIVSFNRDRSLFTIVAEAAGVPRSFFLYDANAMELSPLGSLASQLEGRALGAVEAVSYEARDGLAIPGYLTLPVGKTREDGPFPMVLLPHGGPEARDTAAFDWWSQAYAAAGYAVLRPNFRGSAGYGKAFRDAGFGEFGGKMVDDVVDAIAWAEAEGLSDPRGVCVAGASYGGYSALMTALKAPDKVDCVVAVAPVTNVFGHMGRYDTNTSGYRYWSRYVGGDTFDDADKRAAISPQSRAREYAMPVLLMHGRDDFVVEMLQSQRFVNAWGDRPGLRFVEMDGEDHFVTSTRSRHHVLSESLSLLAAHHPAR